MANLTNAAALIGQQEFRLRVALACVEAAVDIAAEDPGTAGHTQRKALADVVLANPIEGSARFVFTVASNDTISAAGSATDGDIAFAVASTWNALAGV
jgi:hypothetical protein